MLDVYVLDGLLRRVEVVDAYKSFIWTERYSDIGDFQLDLYSDNTARQLFSIGTRITIAGSYYVMEVKTTEDTVSDEGEKILRVTGVSLDEIFRDRVNFWTVLSSGVPEKLNFEGTPFVIANEMFDRAVRVPTFAGDTIPFLQPGILLPPGDIPFDDTSFKLSVDPGNFYEMFKPFCDMFNMGYRLIKNGDLGQLFFEIYMGSDRTSLQSANTPVIFSSELDNLMNPTELRSSAGAKNVAYVLGDRKAITVFADNVPTTTKNFEKRVLFVDAKSVGTDLELGAEYDAALRQKGLEELAKNRPIIAFDGEIPQTGSYEYQVDYFLGDLVETRGADGLATNMRVTEQIFASDAEGVRSYPTLTIDLLITPGSWYAWDGSQVWDNAEGTWADLGAGETIVPSAPAIPTVTSTATISKVNWTTPASGGLPIQYYQLEFADNPTFTSSTILPVLAPTTSAEITQQTPATAYHYRVRAVNGIGPSDWSPTRTVSTKAGISVSLTGPAGTKLTIPTHMWLPGGQTVHPSVVDFGTPWNGYRYWMAHTPYPGGDDSAEDPNIVASTDGTTFVVPAGLTNPLDDQPGSPGAYNSDTDLVYGPDGYLWLFWRTFDPATTGREEKFYLRRSADGVNWLPKVLIWETNMTAMRLMSPALVYEDGAWTMWAINILGTFGMYRIRSKSAELTGPSSWNAPELCTLPSTGAGREPWHVEVRRIDDIYIGLLNDRPVGQAPDGDLYLIRSIDGKTWTKGSTVAIPRVGGTAPGHQQLYRATFTKKTDTSLDVWYSGWNDVPSPRVWNVFRTTLT